MTTAKLTALLAPPRERLFGERVSAHQARLLLGERPFGSGAPQPARAEGLPPAVEHGLGDDDNVEDERAGAA